MDGLGGFAPQTIHKMPSFSNLFSQKGIKEERRTVPPALFSRLNKGNKLAYGLFSRLRFGLFGAASGHQQT
jgi:hypothetical protein